MKIARLILLAAIVCITIFFEKETGIFTFAQSAVSTENKWHQPESFPAALKEMQPRLVHAFHSYAHSQTDGASPSEIPLFVNQKLSAGTKMIALTFDDGPHPKVTEQILEILDRHHAKATFFMVGERVQYYPETVQNVFRRGHEIGNHTWSHSDLSKMEEEEVAGEITATNEAIRQVTGKRPAVFRPPYGSLTDAIRQKIDMQIVLWSADTFDWKHKDADILLTEVTNRVHDQAIVLMHDIYPSTAEGLEQVLQYLEGKGYSFVTVSELYAQKK